MGPLLGILSAAGTAASIGYCGVAVRAALRFRRSRAVSTSTANLPPVSILKPLKGTDTEMYENLRTHCLQNYSEYEILFGTSDPDDPATAVVQKLQREFPNRRILLLHCDKILGANGKVSNLAQMAAVASYDVLLVNDSDIRVASDSLLPAAPALEQPAVAI